MSCHDLRKVTTFQEADFLHSVSCQSVHVGLPVLNHHGSSKASLVAIVIDTLASG